MVVEPKRPSHSLLWIVGALLLLLLFSCALITLVGGAWLMNRSSARDVPAPRVVNYAPEHSATSVPPITVIATPEGGEDYETAVLSNIYTQVNPSVVNVT